MIFYYKLLMVIISPFIFIVIFFIFWILYKFHTKKPWKFVLERFYITSILIILFFMFSIINSCAQFLNCSEIGDDKFITNYLSESCSSSRYAIWKYGFIIPIFLLFATIFPGLILSFMIKNRKNLFTKDNIYKIGYMMNGYKSETFYW